MNLRFKVLVLRLLMAIYSHQLSTVRVVSDKRRQILFDAEEFITDLISKEKDE